MKSGKTCILILIFTVVLIICSAGCSSPGSGDAASATETESMSPGGSSVSAPSGNLADYRFMTEEFAPMNYIEDGELKGISVDLLQAIFENAGVDRKAADSEVMDWPEAYDIVLNDEDTVLFTMAKTGEREPLFKWAGPIMENTNALFAKKSSNIVVNDTGDLAAYKIGAISDTSSFSLLTDSGYPQEKITGAESAGDAFTLLEKGDIDMWSTGEAAGLYYLKNMAANPGDYEVVYRFEPYEFYYAFNIDTPDSVVGKFQEALDAAKKDMNGTSVFDGILSTYTGNL